MQGINNRVLCAKANTEHEIKAVKTQRIGKGAFGEVFRVLLKDGTECAMKVVFEKRAYMNRELQMLKQLSHTNIVQILWYSYGEKTESGVYLNVFMEYIKSDLYTLIKNKYVFSREEVVLYSMQLLAGIAYMHKRNIAHRDLKSMNVLVDTERRVLKICDLGSAKEMKAGEKHVLYICSRNYRAPEIHMKQEYTVQIDMWSCGCVISEMITGCVLYKGMSSVEILEEIQSTQRNVHARIMSKTNRKDIDDVVEIVVQMLVMDPAQRITAEAAYAKLAAIAK